VSHHGQTEWVIWDPVLRLLHWVAVLVFVLNYWILETGSVWHQSAGYLLLVVVLVRLCWGRFGPANARFSIRALHKEQWIAHFQHLKERKIAPHTGHNPFGYLWLYLALFIFTALGVTGFLLEEIDYFFGSDLLETIHGTLADALWLLALIHVFAVFSLQWWGRIALIRPMLTGKRKS
jgi:cytochrome b